MKIICDKEQLMDIINTVQKSIAPKSSMPILECMKIDTTADGHVIVTGTNLDLYIEYDAELEVLEGGTIALTSKMFGEIVRRLPSGKVTLSVNVQNNVTKIKSGVSEFNIQGLSANEYPAVPEISETYRFSVKQSSLKKMIRKTIFATSVNEAKRPILTGSLFEINTKKVKT